MDRLAALQDFLRDDPDDPFTRFALAQEHAKRGETAEALRFYEPLVQEHPDYVGTYYHLGGLYRVLGRDDDARATFRAGLAAATRAGDPPRPRRAPERPPGRRGPRLRRLSMTRRLLALAFFLVPLAATAQSADTYVVQSGDTLFRISRAHGLSVEELRQLNAIEGDQIEVGQTLRLNDRVAMPAPLADAPAPEAPELQTPTAEEPPPPGPATGAAVHVVEPGETLFRIALRYDTSVEELRRLNGIEGDRIEVGQRLAVGAGGSGPAAPGATAPVATRRAWSITDTTVPADLVHFVEPGETLYSIAAAYRVEVDRLASNNALSTAPLRPGTPLYLPRAVNPAEAARNPLPPVEAEGLALVYPEVMAGRATESGETYDPLAFTLSHREYPLGTIVLVTNPASGRSTFARVIDRGPVSQAYLVELSAAAATALDLDPNAAGRVELRRVP